MTIFVENLEDLRVLLGTGSFLVEPGVGAEPCFTGSFDDSGQWRRAAGQARHQGVPLWALPVRVAGWKATTGAVRRSDERLIVPAQTQPDIDELLDQIDLFGEGDA